MLPRSPRLLPLGFALAVALTILAVPALPATPLAWVDDPAALDRLTPAPDLLYAGMDGCLLRITEAQRPEAEQAGATPLAADPAEELYVYLVRDGGNAAFQAPARVLHRAAHEVVLAVPASPGVPGVPPALTEESRSAQSGLRQPIRLGPALRAEPRPTTPPPAPSQTRDPLVQQMVAELTGAVFQPTWQALDDFETRYAYASQNNLATQWLLDQFLAMGLSAEFHFFQDGGTRRNVVATLPGLVDPTKVVYICGHLDATSPTPTTCAPGADDNGSGTAAVLEIARVLRQYQFEYTIKFACFNNEEQGLVGSAAYAADMDAANEDIVAVYNCDMIAYRGTDAAPPDLVIYTNTNSQSVAAVLSSCITSYVGGLIEPVVVNEALSGSDHASFWNHGYKAVCAIEDEAWGADFCPWYHTCNDRIEQYPQDYVLYCAKANLAAVATTAIPFLPQGPYLVVASVTADDDANGGSSGNDDGILNPGETVELWVELENIGTTDATGVSGSLATSSPSVTLIEAGANWNDILTGGSGTNLTALRFLVSTTVGDGEIIPFTLTITDASGARDLPLSFVAQAPALDFSRYRVEDGVIGNNDGVIDPGETCGLVLSLRNGGGQEAQQVSATLSSSNPRLLVVQAVGGATSIPTDAHVDLSPVYSVQAAADAQDGEVFFLNLTMATAAGYQAAATFPIKIGAASYDEVEFDGPWTIGGPDDDATSGQWVRVDPNGTLQNGNVAQTEDDHTAAPGTECFVTGQGPVGGAAGTADVDAGQTTLTSPVYDLTGITNPTVIYWRWYTNNLGNNPGGDQWVVQVSANGGQAWVDLERTTASANAWTQQSFALNSYITPSAQVVFRFVASDEGSASLVEAAVDNFEVRGVIQSEGVETGPAIAEFRLERPQPNPLTDNTTIRFALPKAGTARMELYGVDGRLVRGLFRGSAPAGPTAVTWDGRDGLGRRVPAGVYLCRLEAEGRSLTRRLVVAP